MDLFYRKIRPLLSKRARALAFPYGRERGNRILWMLVDEMGTILI